MRLLLAAALSMSAAVAFSQPSLKMMIGGIILNKSAVNLSQVTPIARLTSEWEVIVVPANSPHKNLDSLLKAFKADPGKVSWGGGSAGGTDHILIGLIAKEIGVQPSRINY